MNKCYHGEIEKNCPECWAEELETIPQLETDNVYLGLTTNRQHSVMKQLRKQAAKGNEAMNDTTEGADCPRCGDTLYPWKHSVMCQDCGAMVECNSDVSKGVFGFVCAKCAPTSDSVIKRVLEAKVKSLTDANLQGKANK